MAAPMVSTATAVIPTPAIMVAIIAVVVPTMIAVVSTAVHHGVNDGPHHGAIDGLVHRLINRLVYGCGAVHHRWGVVHWHRVTILVASGIGRRRPTAAVATIGSGTGANGRAYSATYDRSIAATHRLPDQSPCHGT